jgi:putative toxin-antitoxin system antitoxin component (TIGR02293 family)
MASKAVSRGSSYTFRLVGTNSAVAIRKKLTNAGVTGGALRDIRERLGLTIAEVARILGAGERTVIRKEQQRTALSVTEADRAYRLARIADLATELIGDPDKAKSWLRTPSTYLGGETPVSMLDTEVGADLVAQSLSAIAYGGVA